MRNLKPKTRARFSAVNVLIQTLAGEKMMASYPLYPLYPLYPPSERVYEGKRFRLVSAVPPDEFIYEEAESE